MQPHHHHDCDRCRFLGAVPGPRGPVDLYRCESKPGPMGRTYVARFTSEGPDYTSGGRDFIRQLSNRAGFLLVALTVDEATHRSED